MFIFQLRQHPESCVGLQATMVVVILQSLLSMEPVITRSVVKQEAIRNFQPKDL